MLTMMQALRDRETAWFMVTKRYAKGGKQMRYWFRVPRRAEKRIQEEQPND